MPHSSSIVRYVLVHGVVRWGLPAGALFTLLQSQETDNIVLRVAINVASFGVAGVVFGLLTRRFSARQPPSVAVAPANSPVNLSGPISDAPVEVSTNRGGLIGVALVVLLASAMAFTFRENLVLSVTAIVPLAAGVPALFFLGGTLAADGRGVELRTVVGRFAMRWPDVTEVEVDQKGTPLVLRAGHRRLPLPDQQYCSGASKPVLAALIAAQIRERNIPARQNFWVHYSWPRGVGRDEPRA
jgi:hypothetical protein